MLVKIFLSEIGTLIKFVRLVKDGPRQFDRVAQHNYKRRLFVTSTYFIVVYVICITVYVLLTP